MELRALSLISNLSESAMSWSRTHYLTVGFLMMFCGFHFRIVESFVLTPQTTKFIQDNSDGFDFGGDTFTATSPTNNLNQPYGNSALFNPYQTADYNGAQWQNVGYNNAPATTERKVVTPPTWLGWPMICAGAVLWLFGFTAAKGES